MERSIKILLIVSGIFIVAAYSCQSKKNQQATDARFSTSLAGETFIDTLFYDDDTLIAPVDSVRVNDRFGVWFTPKRDSMHLNCSLVGIQYLFGDSLEMPIDSVMGFIHRVNRYPNDTLPLVIKNPPAITFKFLPRPKGQVTTIYLNKIGKSLAAEDTTDFLIGWITTITAPDSVLFPIGLRDNVANDEPGRSFQWQPGVSIPHSLSFDLGVRAIFKCEKPLPDTGNFVFELRWNRKNTDLDLCFILPIAKDTIYWYKENRTSPSGGRLDVDDNDGYGPEKIFHPYYKNIFQDTAAVLGVYYYGPRAGKESEASVRIYRNSTMPGITVSDTLKPHNWWLVARVNLTNGQLSVIDSVRSSCPYQNISQPPKR